METLNDALIEQLKDLYSAETQLVDALPKMAEEAVNPQLRTALENHLQETKAQVKRLEQISEILDEDLTGHTCKAMKGLIKEGEEAVSEDYECEELKDVQIVAAAQRVEHYEIAGYGNAIALAEHLKLKEVASLLEQTIKEEGNADKLLTSVCQKQIFPSCEAAA